MLWIRDFKFDENIQDWKPNCKDFIAKGPRTARDGKGLEWVNIKRAVQIDGNRRVGKPWSLENIAGKVGEGSIVILPDAEQIKCFMRLWKYCVGEAAPASGFEWAADGIILSLVASKSEID